MGISGYFPGIQSAVRRKIPPIFPGSAGSHSAGSSARPTDFSAAPNAKPPCGFPEGREKSAFPAAAAAKNSSRERDEVRGYGGSLSYLRCFPGCV